MNFCDRSAWRMRFQIQLQKLQKSFCVKQRHREMNNALKYGLRVLSSVLECQCQMNFLCSQRSRLQAHAELIKHLIEQKCEGLQQHQRELQCDGFFEYKRRVTGNQRAITFPACFTLKFEAALSEAFA